MTGVGSLNELWNSTPPGQERFKPETLTDLPEVVQRYLNHTIAPGTTLANAVRLRMQGQIKLKQWLPFRAEQVIRWDRGLIWQASVWQKGIPITGFDRLIDGEGRMQWKLLGLFPVMTAAGNDITRSAIGRIQGELMWLPSVLCHPDISWTAPNASHVHARLTLLGEATNLLLTVDAEGRLERIQLQRWGNPEGGDHHYVDFGGLVEAEASFSGYTIPTQVRAGWYFGSDRFKSEGEFFRARIFQAQYR